MTVEAYVIATALTDGVVREFPFTFSVSAADTVKLVLEDFSTGVQVTIAPEDFSVELGAFAGGTVTYPLTGSPVAAGSRTFILRETLALQTYSVNSQTAYNPNYVSAVWDKIFRVVQELRERANRTLALPYGSTVNAAVPALTETEQVLVGGPDGFSWGPTPSEIANAQANAEQTTQDRLQTGADRLQTGQDRAEVEAIRDQIPDANGGIFVIGESAISITVAVADAVIVTETPDTVTLEFN